MTRYESERLAGERRAADYLQDRCAKLLEEVAELRNILQAGLTNAELVAETAWQLKGNGESLDRVRANVGELLEWMDDAHRRLKEIGHG